MNDCTTRSLVETIAQEHGFTVDAVESMMRSMRSGGGGMAQFDHPEFGGSGQWMRGGMLMISDFSNHELKRRVAELCESIAEQASASDGERTPRTFQSQRQVSGGAGLEQDTRGERPWWPANLGSPETSGGQNDMRYAWFASARRLVLDEGGKITVRDTGDHRIGGVSQQQGADRTLVFTSQHGPVALGDLPLVENGN